MQGIPALYTVLLLEIIDNQIFHLKIQQFSDPHQPGFSGLM
jgi:hypothetical protein